MSFPSLPERILRLNYRQFLSWRYLRSRLVNLLSVAGVMAGVAVLIIVVSIMDGFQERVRTATRGSLSDITLTAAAPRELPNPLADDDGLGIGAPPAPPPQDEPAPPLFGPDGQPLPADPAPSAPAPAPMDPAPPFEELERRLLDLDSRIAAVAPHLAVPVGYFYKTTARGTGLRLGKREILLMEAVGIDFEKESKVSTIEDDLIVAIDPKRPFHSEEAQRIQQRTVLVSRRFAELYLGAGDGGRETRRVTDRRVLAEAMRPVLGWILKINVLLAQEDGTFEEKEFRLRVTGVYEGQDVSQSTTQLFVDLETTRAFLGKRVEYQAARIKLRDYDDAASVKRELKKSLSGFSALTWEDMRRDFLQAVDSEKVLLVIVLSFIIMLGGFIILATLTLTVVEKTRDIGILGALGAPRRGVLSVFLWTGLWIGLLGAALGVLLGRWFTNNVDGVRQWIEGTFGVNVFPENVYRFRSIPTIWDWSTVWTIAAGAILMSFIAGLIPALRAARLDPVKALRHE